MRKGDRTRREIVDRALALAGAVGLEGLTLGDLAKDLELSKSGLFAHFRSKEALQLAVFYEAVGRFKALVVVPAIAEPRGEPRLQALFERYLIWLRTTGRDASEAPSLTFGFPAATGVSDQAAVSRAESPPTNAGRCFFMTLSQEYADRPGGLREALVQSQYEWRGSIAYMARQAVEQAHFREDLDGEQFAFEFVGIAMVFQQTFKLLPDGRAEERVRQAFTDLVARSRRTPITLGTAR